MAHCRSMQCIARALSAKNLVFSLVLFGVREIGCFRDTPRVAPVLCRVIPIELSVTICLALWSLEEEGTTIGEFAASTLGSGKAERAHAGCQQPVSLEDAPLAPGSGPLRGKLGGKRSFVSGLSYIPRPSSDPIFHAVTCAGAKCPVSWHFVRTPPCVSQW